ncbi:hypothetical protein TNCV_899551 [Trichonephila clavipes]|nr:hypothetical protein TNCV_899551 [Trichonephila clavipes]
MPAMIQYLDHWATVALTSLVENSLKISTLRSRAEQKLPLSSRELDSDGVQELLDFQNQKLTVDDLIEMHEKWEEIEKLESEDQTQFNSNDCLEFERRPQFN